MLIRNEKYNTAELNCAVKNIWDSKDRNVIYKAKDSENLAHIFKSGITIPVDELQNPPSPEVLAEKLVEQMESMMKSVSDETFTAYITTESIVPSYIGLDIKEMENFTTAYYTGDLIINPPHINAWMIMRGTFPDTQNGDTYIMLNGERV
jgi:hypothetical protein